LTKLRERVGQGRLKPRDKIVEAVGRLKEGYPKAPPFVTIRIGAKKLSENCPNPLFFSGFRGVEWRFRIVSKPGSLSDPWKVAQFKAARARAGTDLLPSNQAGWSAQQFWETDRQLTIVERAFRVLKSELVVRPIGQQYSGRTPAHIFVGVVANALWKTLGHLAKQAGLRTEIHKLDLLHVQATAQARPLTPQGSLRELSRIQIGDIQLVTTFEQTLVLGRVARPEGEAKRILEALQLELPERLSADRLL
jgi:hypothetical protein